MRKGGASCVAQPGANAEKNLGAVAPARECSLASTIRPLFGRHVRGAHLAPDPAAESSQLDRCRVLDAGRRIRLALAGGEIDHGLGELVRIAGHSGALRHARSVRLTPASRQPTGGFKLSHYPA